MTIYDRIYIKLGKDYVKKAFGIDMRCLLKEVGISAKELKCDPIMMNSCTKKFGVKDV